MDTLSTLEFAEKLKRLQEELPDFFIVMRAHIDKPRTTLGWKGFVHDPRLDGSYLVEEGIKTSRSLLLQLAKLQMPVALEFVDLFIPPYLSDLVSFATIGARSVTSSPHRALASSLLMPAGFKNSIDGNILSAAQGMVVAKHPQHLLALNDHLELTNSCSLGNRALALILRGSLQGPNYDAKSIDKATLILEGMGLFPSILVDCSHDNSQKCYLKQKEILLEVINRKLKGFSSLSGALIESHLFAGNQPVSQEIAYGVSVTDPCLDFEQTKALLIQAHALYSAGVSTQEVNTPQDL